MPFICNRAHWNFWSASPSNLGDEGDAEELPYPDGSFDIVVSLIGATFAPRPERVAAELVRVCRPGGRIVGWFRRDVICTISQIEKEKAK